LEDDEMKRKPFAKWRNTGFNFIMQMLEQTEEAVKRLSKAGQTVLGE